MIVIARRLDCQYNAESSANISCHVVSAAGPKIIVLSPYPPLFRTDRPTPENAGKFFQSNLIVSSLVGLTLG